MQLSEAWLQRFSVRISLRLLLLLAVLTCGIYFAFFYRESEHPVRGDFLEFEILLTAFEHDLINSKKIVVKSNPGGGVKELIITPQQDNVDSSQGNWIRWFIYDNSVIRFSLQDGIKKFRSIRYFEVRIFSENQWYATWDNDKQPSHIYVLLKQKGKGRLERLIFISPY